MTVPITDWDSLWFHLPALARWYQTASFSFLDEAGEIIYDHPVAFSYPHGWHVISALFLMPFQEDFLVTFPMLIAWVIMGLSVYLLSLKFGAKRVFAMGATALVLTIPFFIRIVNTLHIDLPLAAFFMAGLYFAFSSIQNRSIVDLLIFLACLGMILGIKSSGFVYVFFLVTVFIVVILLDIILRKKTYNFSIYSRANLENILRATGILCLLFLGFFWYIKNYVEMGNPLGNVEFKIAGNTVFPGRVAYDQIKKYSLAYRFDLTNFSHWSFLAVQAIFRLQIPFLVMLGQALLLPFAFFVRQKRIGNQTLIGLVALLISTGFLYWNTPYSAGAPVEYLTLKPTQLSPTTGDSIRYGFPFIGVLAVVAAVSATITWTRSTMVAAIVLLSSLLGIVSSTLIDASQIVKFEGQNIRGAVIVDKLRHAPGEAISLILDILQTQLLEIAVYLLLYTLLISITCWLLFSGINRTLMVASLSIILRRAGRWAAIFVCILLLVSATFVARDKRDVQRYRIYGSTYEYISKKVDRNEKIGYLLSQRSYLFYGKNFDKKVLHLPEDSDEFTDWLDAVQQRKIRLVAVGPINSPEKAITWLKNVDRWFVRIAGQDVRDETVLYRFRD
jgi:hypothetical protein